MKKTIIALTLALPIFQAGATDLVLSSEKATTLASQAVAIAKQEGFNVAATVVDSKGAVLAVVRGDDASGVTPKTTYKKAYTAIATQQNTSDFLAAVHKEGHEYLNRFVLSTLPEGQDNIILLGGGVLIKDKGTIIGAIGVGGAPGGHIDDSIAQKAMLAVGI
jgi:uncharacterized protein GlcG (DUF336 family)